MKKRTTGIRGRKRKMMDCKNGRFYKKHLSCIGEKENSFCEKVAHFELIILLKGGDDGSKIVKRVTK